MDEQISRRNFLRGVGATAMVSALAKAAAVAQSAETLDDQKPVGPGPAKMVLLVNGKRQEIAVEPRETLLDVLRDRLQLTGAKKFAIAQRAEGAPSLSTVNRSTPV